MSVFSFVNFVSFVVNYVAVPDIIYKYFFEQGTFREKRG